MALKKDFFYSLNVRAKRATTAGRQARAGENVPRTTRPGLVAYRWRSHLSEWLDEAATRSGTPVGKFVSCRHMSQL